MRPIPCLLAVWLCVAATAAAEPAEDLARLAPAIRRNLLENVVPFWYPRSIDRERGGYLVDFDADGRPQPGGPKMIVTQARMLWLSARLWRERLGGPEMEAAAHHGFRFLADRMWDREHGGFYWEVAADGASVVEPHKHLYGQAFALYALSEYHLATRSTEALKLASDLFALLEQRAHDRRHGGYVEFFSREWGPPPAGVQPYLGAGAPGLKLMNTHLHLMEAMTVYYQASRRPLARLRLLELVTIETQAVIRHEAGAGTDRHERDWTPLGGAAEARASYGHDLENIWLVADALEAAGLSASPLRGLFERLFAYAQAHGYDADRGGFYDSGPLGADADRRDKIWWVQAEALVSALAMFQLTGDAKYADVFARTWTFVDGTQTDWTTGEWHATIATDGRPRGSKGNRWKAGYHNGRALLECLRRIGAMGGLARAAAPAGAAGAPRP